MITFPNAKINLGLNVVEKRSDGYHNLETVFYPIGLADALEVVESEQFSFQATGINLDGSSDNNLVVKAYQLLKEEYDLPPVSTHLHKAIPFGAGLGGGSSDAAFMLKMLNELFQLDLSDFQLQQFAEKLGADCPFFIQNKPAFATGKGEILSPINIDISNYSLVLVKPQISVGTAEAYCNIVPKPSVFSLLKLGSMEVDQWKDHLVNDFEPPVFSLFPELATIKEKLYSEGASFASMTGSGSAIFGLFEHSPINIYKHFPANYFIYRQ